MMSEKEGLKKDIEALKSKYPDYVIDVSVKEPVTETLFLNEIRKIRAKMPKCEKTYRPQRYVDEHRGICSRIWRIVVEKVSV